MALERHQKLVLPDRDRDLFLQFLANPPKPAKALTKAMREFQTQYKPDEAGDRPSSENN